ncbi:MAG: aldehyde dehydrogenase family protein, partial [bacterium]
MIEKEQLYIGGEWVSPASQATIDIISPYTEELVGRVPDGCETDMNAAVAAARQALSGPWADYSAEDRAQLIEKLSAAIGARMQEFAETITLEMGSPATFSLLGQVGASTMALSGFVDHVRNFAFEEERAGALGRAIVRRVPVGVVAGIIPWNV